MESNDMEEKSCIADEEEEEEEDTVAPLCTCGQYSTQADELMKSSRLDNTKSKTPSWLESSFVHLMAPRRQKFQSSSSKQAHHCQPQHGFLEQHQHLAQLLEAATSSAPTTVSLCMDCTDRVAAALEADTQRLYAEVHAYQETVTDSRQRAKTFEAISQVDLEETERAYHKEIEMLKHDVEARETELAHLSSLYKEQVTLTQQLESFEEQAQLEQNALELHAKAFDDSVQLLSKSLSQVQTEVDRLSIVKLPQALFDLQVDEERGLRYPLINQLRLAYRPKGDVPVKEIQVAWSQATQLLLILGTLVQYPSSDWKLVPLSDCAKLIYRKEIYNMSPGDCRSLMAWNALLDQVVRYTCSKAWPKKKAQPPPFPSSAHSIGNTELARLDRMDHVGWSQVIHRMASNLLWLSDRASELVAVQVSTIAHSIV
jgi:hypothetical protein